MGETYDDAGTARSPRGTAHVPYLVALLECDRPLAGGARYSLEGVDRVSIGRGDKREVRRRDDGGVTTLDVRFPGRSLSSSHSRVVRVGTSWAIEDLASKNGTFVSGARVPRAVLAPEDVFEVGHTLLRVNPGVPVEADAPFEAEVGEFPDDPKATLCPPLAAQLDALEKIAPSEVAILVLGATGTGKELLARWVHARTERLGEFIGVNCGALPAGLVESSLFGHVKGAFSGAVRDEPGLVRAAHGGTLFLDEIADLPKGAQAALLRVLQEREVVPVGGAKGIPVDVRLVAATHQPLEEMVARGEFRSDLYARIAGFIVRLPTLVERRDDFGILVAALLRKVAKGRASTITLAPDVGRALFSYDWPLNIRELEQCLAVCVALAPDGRIERSHLPSHIADVLEAKPLSSTKPPSESSTRDERLRLELLEHLARHRGNLADVARAMGKARMQIHRWCRRFGVDPNVYRR